MTLISACAAVQALVPAASPLRGSGSLSIGEWSGTTSQGKPITFTVTPEDEVLTTLTIDYDFNGCTGSHTYESLAVPTAPEVICMSGPCPARIGTSRAFGFVDGSPAAGPYTQINAVFLPGNEARGQAIFSDYPGCGTASAEWTARRR